MNDKQKLLHAIREKMQTLFFLRADAIQELTLKMEALPQEGLEEFLRALEQGLSDQNELLAKLITKDKSWGKNLKKSFQKEYSKHTQRSKEVEAEEAEKLIENL